MSEFEVFNKSKRLIICFGGMTQTLGGIFPFEFKNFLLSTYKEKYDCIFYVDKTQCWYHKGILNITNTIDETVNYLNKKIIQGNYETVTFIGSSAGGYAAILFGSLCNVTNVLCFFPQTKLKQAINAEYQDLKKVINLKTNYLLYGTLEHNEIDNIHNISQCTNIMCFPNVSLVTQDKVNLKNMRDTGILKTIIDNLHS